MRLIVPYTSLSAETTAALAAAKLDYDAIYVGKDDEAYYRLLVHLWGARWDFALVEQDIVVGEHTVDSFLTCDGAWCCAPYPYLRGERYAGLGCVRFRPEIMCAEPDLMEVVGAMYNDLHDPKHWCTLDAWVQRTLRERGYRPCTNHATVGHLHVIPSHGCVPQEFLP